MEEAGSTTEPRSPAGLGQPGRVGPPWARPQEPPLWAGRSPCAMGAPITKPIPWEPPQGHPKAAPTQDTSLAIGKGCSSHHQGTSTSEIPTSEASYQKCIGLAEISCHAIPAWQWLTGPKAGGSSLSPGPVCWLSGTDWLREMASPFMLTPFLFFFCMEKLVCSLSPYIRAKR